MALIAFLQGWTLGSRAETEARRAFPSCWPELLNMKASLK
jgi:hypothetical protein